VMSLFEKYKQKLLMIPEREGYQPLHIGLVGDIYTLIEPYVNLNIKQKLGLLGIHVASSITVSSWLKTHVLPDIPARIKENIILRQASPYLDMCIGGFAWETIGHSIN